MRSTKPPSPLGSALAWFGESCRWISPRMARALTLALAVGGGSVTPCAEKGSSSVAPLRHVWPAPPAESRVVYVQSISGPADLGIRPSSWNRFSNFLTGGNREKEKLAKPFGVALDEQDNLCVTDTATGWVWFFDRTRKSCQHWAKVGRFTFVSPVAIAKRKGIFYVADSGLQKVLAFDGKGKLLFEISQELHRPPDWPFRRRTCSWPTPLPIISRSSS
jgi:hypothetical protein